jgi:hypothetical protein
MLPSVRITSASCSRAISGFSIRLTAGWGRAAGGGFAAAGAAGSFRHAFDVDGGAGFACALSDGIRHRLDVTVGGIIEHEYFGHDGFPLSL